MMCHQKTQKTMIHLSKAAPMCGQFRPLHLAVCLLSFGVCLIAIDPPSCHQLRRATVRYGYPTARVTGADPA